MKLWIYFVLCFGFYFHSVSLGCGNSKCVLAEWIVFDCTPCCAMNALPISAVQKRVLCCHSGHNLAQCMSNCSFTNNDVEQRSDCTVSCQNNCTGGFHFATTTTLTPASTTPTTTKSTTTTPTTTTPTTTTPTTTTSTTTTPTTTTPTTTTTKPTTTTSTTTTPTTTTQTTTTPPTTTTKPTTTTSLTTTSTTAQTTTPTQTTSVPTITPTVSSGFKPVYLSSLKKKSSDPKACTTRNNQLKDGVPLLVWLPLLGVLFGSVATVGIVWISRRKQRNVLSNPKTSVKRKKPSVPIYDTTYDTHVKLRTISNNNKEQRKTSNHFGNNLAF